MLQKGFAMINYIDDDIGVAVSSVMWGLYETLVQLVNELGLTISEKKHDPPATQVMCLGVLIDTVKETIPPEKPNDIMQVVHQ